MYMLSTYRPEILRDTVLKTSARPVHCEGRNITERTERRPDYMERCAVTMGENTEDC